MFDFPNSPTVGQTYTASNGLIWSWDGTAWISTPVAVGEIQIVKTFIPGGSAVVNYSYSKPANLRQVEIEGVAAGGSGSAAIAAGAGVGSLGGGGGGGAYGRTLLNASALPTSLAITIGAPGAASSAGGINAADTTIVGGSVNLTLGGGKGGAQGSNTTGLAVAAGGVGGAATGGWTVGIAGAMGGYSTVNAVSPALGWVGPSGTSLWGGASPFSSGTKTGGSSGSGYGSGSGGATCINNTLQASVAGQPGAILLTEYIGTAPGEFVGTANDENLLVNGSFLISQENPQRTEATVSASYVADQWLHNHSGMTGTMAGASFFDNPGNGDSGRYFLYERNNSANASIAAGAYANLITYIEGFRIYPLKWGKAVAVPAVLNFKARATQAGTYSLTLRDWSGTYSFVHDFVLPAFGSGAWTNVTVPIPVPPGGTWNFASNTGAASLAFAHSAGSTYKAPALGWNAGNYLAGPGITNNAAVANNSLHIADMALYADPNNTGVAPDYAELDWADELATCQRYYEKSYDWNIAPGTIASNGMFSIQRCSTAAADFSTASFKTVKRVAASMTSYSRNTGASGVIHNESAGTDVGITTFVGGTSAGRLQWTAVVGAPYTFQWVANARM